MPSKKKNCSFPRTRQLWAIGYVSCSSSYKQPNVLLKMKSSSKRPAKAVTAKRSANLTFESKSWRVIMKNCVGKSHLCMGSYQSYRLKSINLKSDRSTLPSRIRSLRVNGGNWITELLNFRRTARRSNRYCITCRRKRNALTLLLKL